MRRDGFTLIELMIVVAIIAIIAAIAIPSIQASRKAALETAVIATLRAVVTANEQYRTRFGVYADPIGILVMEYLPHFQQGNSVTEAYDGAYQANGGASWSLLFWPKNPGVTADRSFYVDISGVVRVEQSGVATSTSPPLD